MQMQHSSHQPLVMEAGADSEMSDTNCTLALLIAFEDLIVNVLCLLRIATLAGKEWNLHHVH